MNIEEMTISDLLRMCKDVAKAETLEQKSARWKDKAGYHRRRHDEIQERLVNSASAINKLLSKISPDIAKAAYNLLEKEERESLKNLLAYKRK